MRKRKEPIDLVGKKFNKLTVLKYDHQNKRKSYVWECICDCGNKKYVITSSLISGSVKSCGCIKSERIYKHGYFGTRLYGIWGSIKNRCNNKKHVHYKNYGERGITICEEWNDFIVFKNWAESNGYSDKLSIDRIDNNKGYYPENCKWSTSKEQCNNTRRNWIVGDTGLTLMQYCTLKNISYKKIQDRLYKNKPYYDLIHYEIYKRK